MRLPINLLLWGRYLAFKQDNQYLKQKIKKGGGQLDPELGGHFGPEYPGHFKSESGGQFERNLHGFNEIDENDQDAVEDVNIEDVNQFLYEVENGEIVAVCPDIVQVFTEFMPEENEDE